MLGGVSHLSRAWRALIPGSSSPAAVSRVGDDLLIRWREPHRYYHTVDHLSAVLAVIDEFGDRAADTVAVALAAWFHDAIYDPHRLDNEEASALLAESSLPDLGVPPDQVAEVARLVRLTASHDPIPGDRNGALLTDADLAILGAAPEAYRAYARAVRQEYAFVPEAAFAAGRGGVLQGLLALPRLYHVPALRDRWEDQAKHNISSELAALFSAI